MASNCRNFPSQIGRSTLRHCCSKLEQSAVPFVFRLDGSVAGAWSFVTCDVVAAVGGDDACDDTNCDTSSSRAKHRVDCILRSLLGSSPWCCRLVHEVSTCSCHGRDREVSRVAVVVNTMPLSCFCNAKLRNLLDKLKKNHLIEKLLFWDILELKPIHDIIFKNPVVDHS